MEGCLACDLTEGREEPPGGCIFEDEHLRVEHCIGPLGVGTLVVKPRRHIVRVAELTEAEASGVGTALLHASAVIDQLLHPVRPMFACGLTLGGCRVTSIGWCSRLRRRAWLISTRTARRFRKRCSREESCQTQPPQPSSLRAHAGSGRLDLPPGGASLAWASVPE